MAPTFCNRCGDVVEKGCDPRDELAELDALLEHLTLKRYDLKRKINQFYSPIVCLLPPDVTSTIFEFCLSDFTYHQLLPSEKLLTPLSLGAICSYWRDIAWSTPTLWSSLVVRDQNRYEPHIVTGIAQEWLARSGRLPLSIRISSTFYNKSVSTLIDIINQYSNRWFDLHLNLPHHRYKLFHATDIHNRWSDLDLDIPDRYYQLLHATDNHAPILKSIRFHCVFNMNNIETSNFNLQLTCPRLERADLLDFPLNGSNIQWDNLTRVTLHSMPIFDFFLILRKTPRLVFCEVLGFSSFRRLEERDIGAPALTSLRILHLPININLLDYLIATNLEEFSLPKHYSPPIEDITSFLRRSTCSLYFLSMVFPQYSKSYMNLLESMPSLNTLSILSTATRTLANTPPDDYDPQNIFRLVAKVLSS